MRIEFLKTAEGLVLDSEKGKIFIDFVNDKTSYLRPLKKGKNELIAKAVGIGKGLTEVLDLTAGLAQDAAVLARLGCRVKAVERSPWIFPLLEDARRRALPHLDWVSKLDFVFADASDFLREMPSKDRPQVIYIDPMFPENKKTALPRKEMQIFRELIGEDEDSARLVKQALLIAKDRVIVKRSLKAPDLLAGVNHRFKGTSVRYDLYLPKGPKWES